MLIASNNRYTSSSLHLRPREAAPARAQGVQPQAPKDGFSKDEQQELDRWNERNRFDMGELKTPPAGQTDPEIENARGYVSDVLDRVAGDALSKRGLELRLEIYSGDVPQAALDDNMYGEQAWKEQHPDKPWPVRAWLGAPDDSKAPIYRMAINLGMLRALETEDELAFILAEQAEILLDHDKRDPNNEELLSPANKNYVDPREMRAPADKAAISRMVKAGYNPRGALKALNTLFQKNPIEYPEKDLNRALSAASHDQEAEGMRVGLVQSEVENYVRRGDPTTDKPLTPIPTQYKIEADADYQKPVADLARFKSDFQQLAKKLSGEKTPDWMFGDGLPPKEYGTIRLAGGNDEDREVALLAAVEHLSAQADIAPERKVDGFLRLLTALRHRVFPREGTFQPESITKINSFLKANSANWSADNFLASLRNDPKRLDRSFLSANLFEQSFQEVAKDALPGLTEQVPQIWVTRPIDFDPNNGYEQDIDWIKNLIQKNHSEHQNSWPLAAGIDAATLKFLKAQDAQAIAAQKGEHGLSKATEFTNELLGMDDPSPEFQLQLREAAAPILAASSAVREDNARLRMQPPLQEPKQVYSYLDQLAQSEVWDEFSPEFEKDLSQILKDFNTTSTRQPGFVYTEGAPGAYPEKFEKRLIDLAENSQGQERDNALNHLARHIQPERRISARSPRRAWTEKAAQMLVDQGPDKLLQQLTSPDLSQHSNHIRQSLVTGYQLQPQEMPDTSLESLSALNKRVENGEFIPKREDYQSDQAYEQARNQYLERQDTMYDAINPTIAMQSRLVLGKMALIGHQPELSESVAEDLNKDSFKSLLQGAENAVERAELTASVTGVDSDQNVGADAGGFLMDGFVAVQSDIESLDEWHNLATRSIDFSTGGLEARVGTKRKLNQNLYARLEKLEPAEIGKWLAKDKVMDLLSAQQSSELLVQSLGDELGPDTDINTLAKIVADLDKKYELLEKHPVAYNEMRDKIAEKAQLQPHNVDTVFPEKTRGVTDINSVYRDNARALSGLLAMARERSPQEQIDTVEYLMGRQEEMPEYLEEASEAQSFAPFSQALQSTRQDLLDADNHTRVAVANSFLAGPSGVLRTPEGKETVINHFLKNLHPDNRELGHKIARGVLYSHGEADTLAVAYILGQKPEEPKEGEEDKKGKLDEATILNRLFDAYGVPGIKMKQYLAFTSEFADFKDAFEDAQDAAMPLNYFQVLKLVQKRFGDDWPKDLKIDRVLGSGSVNVAIRYTNEKSGKREVVSLGREDIEESTQYDFDRFKLFIDELTKTPEDRETFGYVLGLLNLIEDSVALEFEKEQAMSVQKMAYKTYKHHRNGWTVKSIDAHRVENLGLFMEEAKGKTARKVFTKSPEVYESAMTAMSDAEFGILKGQTSRNNWWPQPLFANPDFHDGQVLIDEEDKTVTILDFGQAVPIDNEQRKAGLDMLTIIGKADSAKAAAKRLNKQFFDKKDVITPEALESILDREDRMDCFIHLLSLLNRSGADVPLSSVHWILGINRQMALTEKIGSPIDKEVRNMVIAHKVGLPLGVYNTAHSTKETAVWLGKVAVDTAVKVGTTIAHVVGGWFGWEPSDEQQTQQAQAPTEKRKSSYPAWRPDFGGTLPSRSEEAKAEEQAAKKVETKKPSGS